MNDDEIKDRKAKAFATLASLRAVAVSPGGSVTVVPKEAKKPTEEIQQEIIEAAKQKRERRAARLAKILKEIP